MIRCERGQALLLAALLMGLAALAVISISGAQERLLADVRDQRAGEAAAAAAGAAVADLQLASVRALGRDLTPADVERFAARSDVVEAARRAAARMADAQGIAAPDLVVVRAFGVEIEVHLTLRGRTHIVLLSPPA